MQDLFTPAAPTVAGKTLRPYQVESIERLDRAFFTENRNNTILCLAPSGGKTTVGTFFSDSRFVKKGECVLWIAHREELIEQAVFDFGENCPGVKVSTWYKGGKSLEGDVVIASVPSQRSLIDAVEASGKKFGLLVIDEAHHSAADTYQAIIEKISHRKRLGLTGTPKRMDGKDFGFDNIAFQKRFMELVNERYCAAPKYIRFKTKQNHLFQVRAGDFTAGSLKSLNNAPRNEMVSREFFDHPERWPAMVYACNIDHAYQIKAAFLDMARTRQARCRVAVVTGETPTAERKMVVEDMRAGRMDAVINVGVFTEGTDIKTIKSIMLARPTMSEPLYLQMALRGGRSKPGFETQETGGHPDNCFWIVDFVDSAHHYTSASRGFALRAFNPEQVKSQLASADLDLDRLKKMSEMVPQAMDEFQKQFRGIKFEDEELTAEEMIMAKVGSILITSSKFRFERQWVLTVEQDFAVMCGTHYVWERINGWSPTAAEKDELFRYTYELFAKSQFSLADFRDLMFSWVSYKRWGQAKQDNGGRTWFHMASLETPPLQEVYDAIEEIEKEAKEVDSVLGDCVQAWEAISSLVLAQAKEASAPLWAQLVGNVHGQSWGDKQFSFRFGGSPAKNGGWLLEAAILAVVKHLTKRDDVRVTMSFDEPAHSDCSCGGKLIIRSGAKGRFYGCTRYPGCRKSAECPSRATISSYLGQIWNLPV